MNTTEVEDMIAVLDRAERGETSVWRRPLGKLWEALKIAQRTRRYFAIPLLAAAIAAPTVWHETHWGSWLVASSIFAVGAFWVMQRGLERAYPILARETHVQTLWSFFQAWRDSDEGDHA